MNAVVECLKAVRLGDPQVDQDLTVFPRLQRVREAPPICCWTRRCNATSRA
jgi:hypothetical protein